MFRLHSESVSPTGEIDRTYVPADPLRHAPLHLHWNGRGARVMVAMGGPSSVDSTRTTIDVPSCAVGVPCPHHTREAMDTFAAPFGLDA